MARALALEPAFAIKLDPSLASVGVLLEPTSVVAKAWDHIDLIGRRARWEPKHVLVVGAGPIGLLAALLGRQRGLEVHVLDRATTGPKPWLVAALGAHYHVGKIADAGPPPDVVLECTGVPQLVLDAIEHLGIGGVLCLTGVSGRRPRDRNRGGAINRQPRPRKWRRLRIGEREPRHYEAAGEALRRADKSWLEGLITRRVGLGRAGDAFERQRDDVKVVIDLTK